jgi:hypothetical protein
VVESSGLLNRRRVKSSTESSNLSLSARVCFGRPAWAEGWPSKRWALLYL